MPLRVNDLSGEARGLKTKVALNYSDLRLSVTISTPFREAVHARRLKSQVEPARVARLSTGAPNCRPMSEPREKLSNRKGTRLKACDFEP